MEEDVKENQLPATRRGGQARATRRRIVEAASAAFIECGYSTATIDRVAAGAGVAVQTVYFHFGNKRTLLKAALDVAAVGDDEPVPVLERPWLRQAQTEIDPRRVVALWVQASRAILDRSAPIMRVTRDAAVGDPDMAELWAMNERQRDISYRLMADQLAMRDALKDDVPIEQAADVIFAVLSLEMYLLFTSTRKWAPQRWQQWATDILCTVLLG